MTAPVAQREGGRIGGALPCSRNGTEGTISAICRWNSDAVNQYLNIYLDAEMTRLFSTSPAASLNSDNNYQAKCTVSNLSYRPYWYQLTADDGAGNRAIGPYGSFIPMPNFLTTYTMVFMCCSPSGQDLHQTQFMMNNILSLKPDAIMDQGDFIYPDAVRLSHAADNGQTFGPNQYVNPALTLTDYRVDWISSIAYLTDAKMTNPWLPLLANTILMVQGDDHDYVEDDLKRSDLGTPRAIAGIQAFSEYVGDLNGTYIAANPGRSYIFGQYDTDFYVDVGGVHGFRLITPNSRLFRDAKSDPDIPSKTYLGPAQKARILAAILDNPCDSLVFSSNSMFDFGHGKWDQDLENSVLDGWLGCTFERDELLQAMWASKKRVIIISGDTHIGAVTEWTDWVNPNNPKIYEVTGGNLWPNSAHVQPNQNILGASGNGGKLICVRIAEPCCTTLQMSSTGKLKISLQMLYTNRIAWSMVL